MTLALLALAVVVLLFTGYRTWGSFVARQLQLDDGQLTPAIRRADGADFVPTRPFYLLGQHFAAIAAAGPIAGPILAAQQFGWLPALLWIAFGVVFIGAVHDFTTLVASVRHDAGSIAAVVKEHLGPNAGVAMLAFIWVALIYVIVAFVDVTASTFVSGDAELEGLSFPFNPGGAVAAASVMYLLLALVMGLVDKLLRPRLWVQTVIFVPLALAAVWAGTRLSTVLIADVKTWAGIILAYCFLASLAPVWLLLQPRGYLGGFILYLALAVGTVGLFSGQFEVQLPAFQGWTTGAAATPLFPFLFVTIACGACSGFHGLVCSGTTSRQLMKESHCKPVGYGAMLLEGFVALIALATVMIAAPSELAGKAPGAVYGVGLGKFLTLILGEGQLLFATTFGAMAFSTFVFDTLDVSTRLGRYILQELFGLAGKLGTVAATAVTCLVPAGFLLVAEAGAWRYFWALFGTSNQLLAALSLLGITVWLKHLGKRHWYTLYPMLFVSAVTLSALVLEIRSAFFLGPTSVVVKVNGAVCAVLLVLAASLLYSGARALWGRPTPLAPTAT